MNRKILIVDDDAEFLTSVEHQFKTAQNIFEVVTVNNGMEALHILKTTSIALVVSDLEMPDMDGFVLLAYIIGLYPDIPVIMMNDAGEVGAEEIARENGAAEYLEKPFTPVELLKTIAETFNNLSAAGTLSDVSLEMFIQLFEMEQKTCTMRVFDKTSSKSGALFFKDGILLNARINEVEGNAAAYEILSWSQLSVSISDTCPVDEKLIESDVQSLLLEASQRRENRLKQMGNPESSDRKKDAGLETPQDAFVPASPGGSKDGKLSNVSLEMFIQFYAMEEKTGTLTAYNPKKDKEGILYFRKGELIDARLPDRRGNKAAYEIISWDKVTLSISNDCPVDQKMIDENFQEILLEAMRLQDEGDMLEEDFVEEGMNERRDNEKTEPHQKNPIELDNPIELRHPIKPKRLVKKNKVKRSIPPEIKVPATKATKSAAKLPEKEDKKAELHNAEPEQSALFKALKKVMFHLKKDITF